MRDHLRVVTAFAQRLGTCRSWSKGALLRPSSPAGDADSTRDSSAAGSGTNGHPDEFVGGVPHDLEE